MILCCLLDDCFVFQNLGVVVVVGFEFVFFFVWYDMIFVLEEFSS